MKVQTAAGLLAERFGHKAGLQTLFLRNVAGQASQGQHVIADFNDAMAMLQV